MVASGLDSLLAAQALFPIVAQFEMAGNPKENEVSGAMHDRIDKAWPIIAKRVRINPEYGKLFVGSFGDIERSEQVTIVEIAKALAAFMGREWRSYDSAFDRFLHGDKSALTFKQEQGMKLFYGKAKCARCHSGSLFSDQKFHALALPPFGPGRTRKFDPYARDVGLMGESDRLEDAYRFRTPMLRNVTSTAPYGHNGAYPTLEGIIQHHLNPEEAFESWDRRLARLLKVDWLQKADFLIAEDKREMSRIRSKVDIEPLQLSEAEIDQLVAFMSALDGSSKLATPLGRPSQVPSGLAVD